MGIGNVVSEHSNRSYIVKTNDGSNFRRNRKHIRLNEAQFKHYQNSTETEISDPSTSTIAKESSDEKPPIVRSTPQSADLPKTDETVPSSSCVVTRSGRVVKPPKKFADFAN